MHAIVMAGGNGSRMRPLVAEPLPKHLIPLGERPLIWYVLKTLIDGGVDQIVISLNGPRPDLTILTITSFDLRFPVGYTNSSNVVSGGPGRDLAIARPWIPPGEDVIITLADSLFFTQLDLRNPPGPHIWTMELDGTDDPSRYGQVTCEQNRVTHIWEKPEYQQSNLIQTGIWKLPYDCFDRAADVSSAREGEVHVGDVTKQYVHEGLMTHTRIPPGSYIDCGTPEAYRFAQARF